MEFHLKVCFSLLVHLAIHISIAGADFSTQPDSQTSTCVGIDLPLDWTINNEASITNVVWSLNGVAFAFKVGSGGTPSYSGATGITAAKVEHTTSGKIVIKNSVVADSGEYSCNVAYLGASGFVAASSTATVAVVTAPSDPTCTKTDDTYTCATDSTSVTVTIKVDNVDKGTTTYTGAVDSSVECCLSGYAVQCRDDTSGTEYCKVLYTAALTKSCFSQAGCTAGVVLGSIYGTSWLVAIVVNLVIYCMNQMLLAWNLCDGPMKRLWIWILLFIFLPYIPSVISIYLFRTNRPAKKPTSGMELEKNGTP